MTQVRATVHGYFGGVVRAPGDTFDVPDELWADEKRRPKWVEPVKGGEVAPAADEPEAKPKGRGRRSETVEAPTAEPFADAPEPVAVKGKGNGVKDALGVDPDWVAPKPID